MRWINVQSVEELKTLGKFNDLKKEIKNDVEEKVKISGRSWDDVYKKIVDFRNITQKVGKELDIKPSIKINDEDTYFTSKANEYIFYLTELDGEIRMKKLGVTKTHFTNKKKAKTWRDKISKEIHPDKNKSSKATDAMTKLNNMYSNMIGKE